MERSWSPTTKYLVISLYTAGLIWLLFAARPLVSSLMIAFILGYVLNPVVEFLTRRTALNRDRAAVVTYLAFIILIVAASSSFTSLAVRQIRLFAEDVDSLLAEIEVFAAQPLRVGQFTFNPPRETILSLDEEIRSVVSQASAGAVDALSGIGANLVWLIVILVTAFYLLRDRSRLYDWFIRLFPGDLQPDVERLMGQMDVVWSTYLRGQVILGAIVGVLTGVSMALVGLRGAVIIGVIVGILDLIPSLGPLVGGVISVLVALILGSTNLAVSNFWFGVIVGGIFVLIQQFENIWLAPRILGRSLNIHPALVVIAVLGALALVGILGALIIIPVMASVFIVSRYVHARLLDRDPWAAAETDAISQLVEVSPPEGELEPEE